MTTSSNLILPIFRRGKPAQSPHPTTTAKNTTIVGPKKVTLLAALFLVSFWCFHDEPIFGNIPRRRLSTTNDATICPVKAWTYPDCRSYIKNRSSLPPNTPQKWKEMRTKYVEAVGGVERSSLPSTEDDNQDGFYFPVQARNIPGKGRGLFVKEFVPKGTQIWDNRYVGRFPNECTAKTFFSSLSNDDACEAVHFLYVNDYYGDGYQLQVALDAHAYTNEANKPQDRNAEVVSKETGSFGYYAIKDIPAGSEIMIEYDTYKMDAPNKGLHVGPFSLLWYERLVIQSQGLWSWMSMY